ncbi:UNVERIFIED_CONTAM: hypothetical protein GTU68_027810 [Idotea baltica]|nr:hypothetical protein [Idotea baltica]
MRPKVPSETVQRDLFQAQFDQILNLDHPLCVLAGRIDWKSFDELFAECYSPDMGAPAKSIRLLVGLHYLKHAFNESDPSVLERWVENPYWQYFCGIDTMQHEVPLDDSSMSRWRTRIGGERLAAMLEETVAIAVRDKNVSKNELKQVNVDTTVQEKNITHPTDSKLYLKALTKLADAAKHRGIKLRQTYRRVAKREAIKAGRYAHAKQFRRMRRSLKKLRTMLGRVIRDMHRKVPSPDLTLQNPLRLCERLHAQQKTDTKKLYSLHEPDVQCISKGKAHKRYEFGQKVSVTSTNRANWIVGINLRRNNPYDGHTLAAPICTAERMTGVDITDAFVDKGFRGHDYEGEATVHISGGSKEKLTRTQKKRRRRRSAVEQKIGHLKSDNRMGRCFLSGGIGDEINSILAAYGSNLRKLLGAIASAPILLRLSVLKLVRSAFSNILSPVNASHFNAR